MTTLHRFFFFLTIVFLPIQVGRHFWPTWASVLGRRVDYLSPTFYLTDILILLTIFFWTLANKFSIKRKNGKFLISIVLFGSFVGINIFFAQSRPTAVYSWLKVLELAMFGYYMIKTKPKLPTVIFGLSVAIFYSSTIAIVQFFLQHSIGGPLWLLGERTFSNQTAGIAQINICVTQCRLLLRPYATFPHPNVLGGFLAITIPLLLLTSKSTNRRRNFTVLTVFLGLFALFLSFSRSAWLAGALGIGWVFIPKKLKGAYTLCSVTAFILGIFLVKDFAGTSESVFVREQLNSTAIILWQHSPIFGIGLGNFLVHLPAVLPSRTIYFLQPVHNIYLLLLSEVGIIGFIIFLGLIFSVIKNNKFSIITNSLFLILLLGLVDHYPFTLQQGQLLFVLFLSLSFLKYN